MLNGTCTLNFKEAVFIVENAYYSNQLSKPNFDKKIKFQTNLVNSFIASRELLYDYPDKEEVKNVPQFFQ